MRYGPLAVFVAICVLPGSWALAQTSQESEPIGRVTAAFGVAAVETPDGVRKGDLNTLIVNGDRVRTNGGGVTVLLASRVVLKIDHDTTISLSESPDQLNVILERGTVHVFVGQRPLAAGAVSVQDPHVRAVTQQGVFLASYDPRARTGYYACEHANLVVESTRDGQTVSLSPDMQLVVTNGQINGVEELDRFAFNQRKQSLERLGQAVKEQGAETFRIRSRMFDTQLAITQLSEAGWIDASTLQAQQQAAKSKAKKTDEQNSQEGESDNPQQDGGSTGTAEPSAPAQPPSNTQAPAPTEAPAEPVLTDVAPVDGDRAIPANSSDQVAPPAVADLGTVPPSDDRGRARESFDPPGNAVGLDRSGNDNSGPGNSSGFGNLDSAPALSMETPDAPPSAPTAELDLNPNKGPKVDLDLGRDVGKGKGKGATPPLKLDLGDIGSGGDVGGSGSGGAVAPPAPPIKLDLDLPAGGGNSAAPNPVDLDFKPRASVDNSGSGKGKADIAPPANLDNKTAVPVDLKPKVDLEPRGNSGSGTTLAPLPKIDLPKDVAVPKNDAITPPPAAPKIDLGLPSGGNVAGQSAIKGGDIKLPNDAVAPLPNISGDLKAPAAIDIKTPVELAPKLDLAKPAGDLPTKIDLGGSATAPPPTDLAPPKLDLDPKLVKGDAPKVDLDPKTVTEVRPWVGAETPSLDAPLPKIDVPTDLTKDAVLPTKDAVVDIPTPGDLGVDLTKDIAKDATDVTNQTTDATKDALDVVKDITKDASGHDGSTSGKGGKKRKGK